MYNKGELDHFEEKFTIIQISGQNGQIRIRYNYSKSRYNLAKVPDPTGSGSTTLQLIVSETQVYIKNFGNPRMNEIFRLKLVQVP